MAWHIVNELFRFFSIMDLSTFLHRVKVCPTLTPTPSLPRPNMVMLILIEGELNLRELVVDDSVSNALTICQRIYCNFTDFIRRNSPSQTRHRLVDRYYLP